MMISVELNVDAVINNNLNKRRIVCVCVCVPNKLLNRKTESISTLYEDVNKSDHCQYYDVK